MRRTILRENSGQWHILLATNPFYPCTTLMKQLTGKDEELSKALTNKIEGYFFALTNSFDNMIEKEISETYFFNPDDFNEKGRRESDGLSFRDLVKDFEYDFHRRHSTEYALNLYCNSRTMRLLERACDAAPFMMYGMDLTQGNGFDAKNDPFINHEMDKQSKCIYVYGIDSAFMTNFDEYGIPILSEDEDIYPLTLLVAETMKDGTIRLAVPTIDDDFEDEIIPVEAPKYELV